jgi:SAM-dependent methyltransferase
VIPWTLEGLDLGRDVLELGPGYGATTDILRTRCTRLTCVEMDRRLAERLRRRYANGQVIVRCEDATAMSLPNACFDAVVCFTMLHHVPSAELQDRLLAEAARVLRSGGVFLGRDSLYTRRLHLLHVFDTMVLVDPRTFGNRLEAAGFERVQVDVGEGAFRFRAWKP